ncbi:MAG: hypothetical protein LQ352_004435 [Teloschistes flavicans]|nr:MAG: hypothetical protein LQ352_004435 [Teloschistes flavicans]
MPQSSTTQQSQPPPQELFSIKVFPYDLHPTPRNFTASERRYIPKEQQRNLEHQAWANHARLICKLEYDPYDRCICDALGLDETFQTIRDPDMSLVYAHRPDCLAYPMPMLYKIDIYRSGTRSQYLSRVREFSETAGSRTGSKRFTQKALRDLRRQCGLQPLNIPIFHCKCDLVVLDMDPKTDRKEYCEHCRRPCCPCCSPECHGLRAEDSRSRTCTVEDGTCCPQCYPACHNPATHTGADGAGPAHYPNTFRDMPRRAAGRAITHRNEEQKKTMQTPLIKAPPHSQRDAHFSPTHQPEDSFPSKRRRQNMSPTTSPRDRRPVLNPHYKMGSRYHHQAPPSISPPSTSTTTTAGKAENELFLTLLDAVLPPPSPTPPPTQRN